MLPDQRGAGRSDRGTVERWTLDTWIADIPAFCDALGIEHPILLGQSFRGIVALGVAARHPQLPAKLIVSSSAARIRLDRALPMFERLGGAAAREVAVRFFESPTPESLTAYWATCLPLYNPTPADPDLFARAIFHEELALHFWADEIKRFDLFPEVVRIACPTLILAGKLDPITTIPDHQELSAAIRGSRLEIFPDAGHGVFRDKPEEALAVIRDFLMQPTPD